MKRIAILPGSFDPITLGHVDIIQRSLKIFDKIIIVIANNDHKTYMFNSHEKMQMIKSIFENEPKIEIIDIKNQMLSSFMKENNYKLIIRGLRIYSDFEYEMQLNNLYKDQNKDLEIMFMPNNNKYSYCTSSIVRDLINRNANFEDYTPKEIHHIIRKKVKNEK